MPTPDVIALLLAYRYTILFPLAAVEGAVVSLVAGWFIATGTLSVVPTYIILLFADLIPDSIYYFLGRRQTIHKFTKKYGARFGLSEERFEKMEYLWINHTFKSALFSKWAYGLSTPLLMTAGLSRIPYRTFVMTVLPISIVQYAVMLTLGYYAGASYRVLSTYITYAGIVVTCVLLLFLAVTFMVSRSVKKRLFQSIV